MACQFQPNWYFNSDPKRQYDIVAKVLDFELGGSNLLDIEVSWMALGQAFPLSPNQCQAPVISWLRIKTPSCLVY